MNQFKILFFLLFFLPFLITAKTQEPKITVSFPESFYSNEEIKVFLSVSSLKESFYDLKISIERERVLSETFNQEYQAWKDSYNYQKSIFRGPKFEGSFKLRLKNQFSVFEGKADLIVRIRESGKSKYTEYRGVVNILKPEIKNESLLTKNEVLAETYNLSKNNFFSENALLIATLLAVFSAITILILKLNLKSKN